MTKQKNNLTPLAVTVMFCVGIGLFIGGFAMVSNANNDAITVNDGGTVNITNNLAKSMESGMIGGTTNYDDLEVDSLTVSGDITVGDDLTVTGNDVTVNGLQKRVVSGTCSDATTTPIAIASPFTTGTSTAIGLYVTIDGVSTSTVSWDCGVATDAFTSSDTLIDGQEIATDTLDMIAYDTGTNGRATDRQTPTEYLTCTLTGTITAGITNDSNTFTCSYKAEYVQ